MAAHGIRDRVAIVGMGCTPFAERFDAGLDDLILEAAGDALGSAGIERGDVDAWWVGTAQSGSNPSIARLPRSTASKYSLRSTRP